MSSNSDIDRIVNERLEEVAVKLVEGLVDSDRPYMFKAGIVEAVNQVRAAKTELVVYGPGQTVRSKETGSIFHLGHGGYLLRGCWFKTDSYEFTSADCDLVEIPGADS
jgi:hypothetical protein